MGYTEAMIGFGLIVGPVFGSVLFSLGGFSFTFMTFGIIFLVIAILIKNILPRTLDADYIEEEETLESPMLRGL